MNNTDNQINSIHDGIAYSGVAIQEVMKLLGKLFEQKEENSELNKFLAELKDDDKGIMFTLDDAIYGRTIKEMVARDIPFCAYDIKGKSQKCIIVAEHRAKDVASIAACMKIRVGLTVDNKKELDAAIWENELSPKEYELSNLSGPMAQKIMEFCKKHNIVAALEKQEDGSYNIYSQTKDAEHLNRFAYSASWDLTGTSGQREMTRLEYDLNERHQIEEALEKLDNTNIMEESYIYCADNPKEYIYIQSNGFSVIKDGRITATIKQDLTQEEYGEYLRLRIREMDNPIYMTKDEVDQKGGPASEDIYKEIEESRFRYFLTKEDGYTIQAEKALRNYIENELNIGPQGSLETVVREMPYIDLDKFKRYFEAKSDRSTPEKEANYQRILSHLNKADEHMIQAAQNLKTIKAKEINVQRPIDISIEVAKQAIMDEEKSQRLNKEREQQHEKTK